MYSGTTDPYLSFLSDNHSLFSTKPTTNGKKSDPLKFSDPLSFGTSDPLRFGLFLLFYQCVEKIAPRKIVTQSILSGYLEKLVKVI